MGQNSTIKRKANQLSRVHETIRAHSRVQVCRSSVHLSNSFDLSKSSIRTYLTSLYANDHRILNYLK